MRGMAAFIRALRRYSCWVSLAGSVWRSKAWTRCSRAAKPFKHQFALDPKKLGHIPAFVRASGQSILADVEALFLRSLDEARQQGALSWELRTAMNLARLWTERRRRADAGALLRPVYASFTEGFATDDCARRNELPMNCRSWGGCARLWPAVPTGLPVLPVDAYRAIRNETFDVW